MSTTTFPTALLTEDEKTSALLILVDEQTVDVYGAKQVKEVIESHPWVIEQDLPILIAWNLDDDPKIYGQGDWVDWLSENIDVAEIPWDYELTLDWSDYEAEEDEEEDEEYDEEYDEEEDEEYDEEDEEYDEDE